MKINALVLGAAGVLAAASAQAADLPVAPAPEPIDYVRICDAYGSGFFFIPGTETCMKISGYVRFNGGISIAGDGSSDYGNQVTSPLDTYARGNLRVDVRENTAWGTLRGYLALNVEKDMTADADGEPSGETDDISTDGAFIEIGDSLILGYSGSAFSGGYNPVLNNTALYGDATSLVVAYTADFGNGVLATLALEDNHDHSNGITDAVGGASLYNGIRYPDIVGNIAYSSGVVSATARGAVHWVGVRNDTYGKISDEVGFAVGATVTADLPFLAGVTVGATANYGIGASEYVCNGCGWVDAAYDGTIELMTVYALSGGLSASITDELALNFGGGYAEAEVFSVEQSFSQMGTSVAYSPLDNLSIQTGINFTHATSEIATDDGWDGAWSFRVQRNF